MGVKSSAKRARRKAGACAKNGSRKTKRNRLQVSLKKAASKFPIFIEKIENDIKNGEDFIDFCKGDNARYGFSEFYTNMVGACLFNSSPAASPSVLRLAGEFKDLARSPTGEWMRRRMETTDMERVCRVFHDRAAAAYRRAVEMGQAGGYEVIAVDVSQVDRWDYVKPVKGKDDGKRPALLDKEERDKAASDRGLVKGRATNGTPYHEAYLAAHLATKRSQLTLRVMHVDSMAGLERFVPEIARALASMGIRRGMLLFDRGFFTGPMIEALNATRFDWMMPCKNTPTVKKALAGAGAGARGKVVQMAATGKDGEPARYWMKVTRRRRGEEEEEEEKEEDDEGAGGKKGKKGKKDSSAPHHRLIGFASNLREIDISLYRNRWRIEARFDVIKDRRCKTSSTSAVVRYLCIIFSFYLANLWAMMNLIYMNSRSGRPRIPMLTMTALTMITFLIKEPKPPP